MMEKVFREEQIFPLFCGGDGDDNLGPDPDNSGDNEPPDHGDYGEESGPDSSDTSG